jgi:putative ABC transport system substrate-binding protein
MGRGANALLFVLILLVPFVSADAQQPRVYRLGYLGASGLGPNPFAGRFVQELRARGWVEGQNLVIEYRWAGVKIDEPPRLAGELTRLNLDVIVTGGTGQ